MMIFSQMSRRRTCHYFRTFPPIESRWETARNVGQTSSSLSSSSSSSSLGGESGRTKPHQRQEEEAPRSGGTKTKLLVDFRKAHLRYPSVVVTTPTTTGAAEAAVTGSNDHYGSLSSIVVEMGIEDPIPVRSSRREGEKSRRRRGGGHALVGRNAMGKSLIGQTIVAQANNLCPPQQQQGQQQRHKTRQGSQDADQEEEPMIVIEGEWEFPPPPGRSPTTPKESSGSTTTVAHVSFDSHYALLQESAKNATTTTTPITTFKAISEGAGRLNKAAQFLIVRFGLYGLLSRPVDTLSTGEIRKTLLVRALSQRPRLLILDNAFDGLDVTSREVLKQMVHKTIVGFHQDILVQGVNSNATAQTQILMMTHRPEELVDAIQHLTYWAPEECNHGDNGAPDEETSRRTSSKKSTTTMKTVSRNGQSGMELFEMAFNLKAGSMVSYDWDDASIPSIDTIASWWQQRRQRNGTHQEDLSSSSLSSVGTQEPITIVSAHDLSIRRGEATLLHDLNWSVTRGERWLVGGDNGAGKSTLSRLLAARRPDPDDTTTQGLTIHGRVGWVSTERHMEMMKSEATVLQLLLVTADPNAEGSMERTMEVATWLGLDDEDILHRPFCYLSQGQQKLVLIGAAVACQPDLLVLDEPCQGLDIFHRQLVLALVERICRATDMSLVYITHHLEELLPSVSHALHLKDKRAAFQGPIQNYNPKEL